MRREVVTMIAVVAVAVAATGSLVPLAGAGHEATTDCAFSAAERTLAVRALHASSLGFSTLDREGDAIRVLDQLTPIGCAGGMPDVHNTDSIAVSNEAGAVDPNLFIDWLPRSPRAPRMRGTAAQKSNLALTSGAPTQCQGAKA
jgi:hypothetical protein